MAPEVIGRDECIEQERNLPLTAFLSQPSQNQIIGSIAPLGDDDSHGINDVDEDLMNDDEDLLFDRVPIDNDLLIDDLQLEETKEDQFQR